MWQLVGIDGDGAEHCFRKMDSEAEAQHYLSVAMPMLEKMKAPYLGALVRAEEEQEAIGKMPDFRRPLYTDYWGWKEQGFFVEKFVIREYEC